LIIKDGRTLETGGLRAWSRSGSQSVESRWATANIGERIDRAPLWHLRGKAALTWKRSLVQIQITQNYFRKAALDS
jgi:hypothetical protein